MKNLLLKVLSVMLPVSCCACASVNWQKEKADIAVCVYHFGDSSTPPEYHRSYSIIVTADSIRVSIDSYGRNLLEKTYHVSRLDTLVEKLSTMDIRTHKHRDDPGCSGGTSESLSIRTREKSLLNGYVYHCGGDEYGTLEVRSGSVSSAFHQVLPESIDKLIESTREHFEE